MVKRMKIIVTGISGFIGSRFLELCDCSEFEIVPVSLRNIDISNIDFEGINAIVHLAGLAEQKKTTLESDIIQVNTNVTIELARAAKQAGVNHFVFMSSIKVYGDNHTTINEKTICQPGDDVYGKSKLMAEEKLLQLSDIDFVVSILRSPVVYGPNVKGNILRLLKLSDSSLFLPFGGINNKRSMVFVDNVVEFIFRLLKKPLNDVFLVADSKPVSTTEMVLTIRQNLGLKSRLWEIPNFFLKVLKKLSASVYSRLFESMEVNPDWSFAMTGYSPNYSFEEGMKITVDWYKSIKSKET